MNDRNVAEGRRGVPVGDCDCDYCSATVDSNKRNPTQHDKPNRNKEDLTTLATKSPWSRDDKNLLISMFKQGSGITQLADVLQRSGISIVWKLYHLGLISDVDISNTVFRAQKRHGAPESLDKTESGKTVSPKKIQAVVVANSYKNHGRCLAVIDLQTSELLRPVADESNRAVQETTTLVNTGLSTRKLKPGDFVTIPLLGEDSEYWQRENWFLEPGKQIGFLRNDQEFLKVRARNACKEHYELPDFLLINHNAYLEESEVSRATPSLELRLVTNVKIFHRTRANGKSGLRAEFTYRDQVFSFAYTDEYSGFVHGTTFARAMVCLSLGEAINGRHYKLVAGLLPVN